MDACSCAARRGESPRPIHHRDEQSEALQRQGEEGQARENEDQRSQAPRLEPFAAGDKALNHDRCSEPQSQQTQEKGDVSGRTPESGAPAKVPSQAQRNERNRNQKQAHEYVVTSWLLITCDLPAFCRCSKR